MQIWSVTLTTTRGSRGFTGEAKSAVDAMTRAKRLLRREEPKADIVEMKAILCGGPPPVGLRKQFASDLGLMAERAMRLGLLRTSHAFSRPQELGEDGQVMGPLAVVGFEISDIMLGKQADLDLTVKRKRK